MARSPSDLHTRLREAPLELRGYLANASNGTLLATLGRASQAPTEELLADPAAHGVELAIYKPRDGERPLRDFPSGTLCQREVAAYEVSAWLGWDLVPPTVLRDGPLGPGSVQLFVPHDPRRHYFTVVEEPDRHRELTRFVLFDLACNNADRKASHIIAAGDGRLLGVDHGLAFHVEEKMRTVMWDLEGEPFDPRWCEDLRRLGVALGEGADIASRLAALLDAAEVAALSERAERAAALDAVPSPPTDRRPYPWPPL